MYTHFTINMRLLSQILIPLLMTISIACPSSAFNPMDQDFDALAQQYIDLINQIIADPSKATMANYHILFSQYSEEEQIYYYFFISDGTRQTPSHVQSKMKNHFDAPEDIEPSVVLQQIRLNLLLLNETFRWIPSEFQLQEVEIAEPRELTVHCVFIVTNERNQTLLLPAKVFFSVGDNFPNKLDLWKIEVDGQVIYSPKVFYHNVN